MRGFGRALFCLNTKQKTESGVFAASGYGIGLLVSKGLASSGVDLATKAGMMKVIGYTGSLSIITYAAFQLIKLKMNHQLNSETVKIVGKQTAVSASLLVLSMLFGSWFGFLVGLAIYSGSLLKIVKTRKTNVKIQEYIIEASKPQFANEKNGEMQYDF